MEAPSACVLGMTLALVALTKEVLYLLFVAKVGLAVVVPSAGKAALSALPTPVLLGFVLPHALWALGHLQVYRTLSAMLGDANGRVR